MKPMPVVVCIECKWPTPEVGAINGVCTRCQLAGFVWHGPITLAAHEEAERAKAMRQKRIAANERRARATRVVAHRHSIDKAERWAVYFERAALQRDTPDAAAGDLVKCAGYLSDAAGECFALAEMGWHPKHYYRLAAERLRMASHAFAAAADKAGELAARGAARLTVIDGGKTS